MSTPSLTLSPSTGPSHDTSDQSAAPVRRWSRHTSAAPSVVLSGAQSEAESIGRASSSSGAPKRRGGFTSYVHSVAALSPTLPSQEKEKKQKPKAQDQTSHYSDVPSLLVSPPLPVPIGGDSDLDEEAAHESIQHFEASPATSEGHDRAANGDDQRHAASDQDDQLQAASHQDDKLQAASIDHDHPQHQSSSDHPSSSTDPPKPYEER